MTKLPLGGVFVLGGSIQWGQSWSLDSGGSGGLSEQCVFVTTEGEVAAYTGLSPDADQGWEKVGVYRVGRPMGKRAFVRAGGDLLIASTVGLVSLAAAAQADIAALGRGAVSYPIEDEWSQAVRQRGEAGWQCETWPDDQMIAIVPPYNVNHDPVVFAINSNTGAWADFTGWVATSIDAFGGRLYLGKPGGVVSQAWVGGTDDGMPFIGEMMPLFSDMGAPASRKVPKLARAVIRTAHNLAELISARFDFDTRMPTPPNPPPATQAGVWGSGIWCDAIWSETVDKKTVSKWRGIGGTGNMVSLALQITSANAIPLDAEVIRLDLMFETGDIRTFFWYALARRFGWRT